MRLADAIIVRGCDIVDEPVLAPFEPGMIRDAVDGAVCFDFNNIRMYHDDVISRDGYVTVSDLPAVAPPFETTWFEWSLPGGVRIGTLLLSPEDTRPGVPDDERYVAGFIIFSVGGGVRPRVWSAFNYRFQRETGAYTPNTFSIPLKATSDSKEASFVLTASSVTLLGIGLLHCRNITSSQTDIPEKHARAFQKRNGRLPSRFTTLTIEPMKQVLHTEGGIEQHGLKKALHICRGHFAHYSEDKPLFGKYTGTFWRPAHVRGSAEAGTVYKDYKVKP